MAKRSKKRCEELPILHPHAAGIDVGASELFVAVSIAEAICANAHASVDYWRMAGNPEVIETASGVPKKLEKR
jgi:hypothetical protein